MKTTPKARNPVSGSSVERLSISISSEDKAALERIAEAKRVSLAWVIRDAISRLLTLLQGTLERRPFRETVLRDRFAWDYPLPAVRELLLNAIIHRNYESNSPVRFYRFANRLEIQNPGGLYGDARPENFPRASDYRNPILAEALKILGYVNRFGRGVLDAQKSLRENGSGEAEFEFEPAFVGVTIPKHPEL